MRLEATGSVGRDLKMPFATAGVLSRVHITKHNGVLELSLSLLIITLAALSTADSNNKNCDFQLTEAVASFGAEGVGDELFVYSGHIGRTHAHSQANLSSSFTAFVCSGESEPLAMRDALQGTALVAHQDALILIGGLQAFNPTADTDEDLVSTAVVRRFDTGTRTWKDLPPLPRPRSSHDAVVLNDVLYVVGGWTLGGQGVDPVWVENMLALNLRDPQEWRLIDQPFQRRALAVTHDGERVIAIGGFEAGRSTSRRVDAFDPASGQWSAGPQLPEVKRLKGFGAAAEHFDGRAIVSIADGSVLTLVEGEKEFARARWEKLGQLKTPRFFHELAVVGDQLYAIGGASATDGHLTSIEPVRFDGALTDTATDPGSLVGDWAGFRRSTTPPGEIKLGGEQWRQRLTGYGQSAPVVFGGRIFVTATSGDNLETQHLVAYDLDGSQLWHAKLASSEQFESSDMIARAAPTPVVDRDHIYVLFGSGDVAAFRHDGGLAWQRNLVDDYGSFAGNHGVANSLLRTQKAVVLQVARKTYAYLLALDPATGQTLWKTDRDAGPGWTTPTLSADGSEIVVSVSDRLEGFDPETGVRRWALSGFGGNSAPSPLVAQGYIGVPTTRSGGFTMLAYQPGQEPQVLWKSDFTGHFGSPLLTSECVLVSNNVGATVCYEPATGRELWKDRLAGAQWATPVLDGVGNLVSAAEKGVLQLLAATVTGLVEKQRMQVPIDGRVYAITLTTNTVLVRTGTELIAVR